MLRRSLCVALVLVLLVGAAARLPAAGPEPLPLAVIVHPSRHANVSVADLAQIYLRRKRFWDDGTAILPLNLAGGTPLRLAFSRSVLRDSEERLAEYWNRQYFYGILPPATLASTEAVLRYVASDPNAIGYVPVAEVNGSVADVLHIK